MTNRSEIAYIGFLPACKKIFLVVSTTWFEHVTYGLGNRCSIRLSYVPTSHQYVQRSVLSAMNYKEHSLLQGS